MPMAKRTSIISGRSSPPPPCCMKDRNALRAEFIGLLTFSPCRQLALCRGLPTPLFHYHLHVDQTRVYPHRRRGSPLAAYSFRRAFSFLSSPLPPVQDPPAQHLRQPPTRALTLNHPAG